MNKLKNQGFTLVELIVVITILSILGTIAFISLQGYSAQARDSTRISDLSTIRTGLELFQLDAGKYPLPTDGEDITYSGGVVWNQGIFGESVFNNVEHLDKIPRDPLTNSVYTYSVIPTRSEYEIAGITETDLAINMFDESYAGEKEAVALVTGTYNGQMTKTLSGELCNALSIPTIIASDIETSTDIVEISNNKRFVYTGFNNLPHSYTSSKYNVKGGFDFKPNKLVAYTDTGSCSELSSKSNFGARVELLQGLQDSYTGTTLKGNGKIKRILSLNIDISSPSIEVQNFAGSFVNNNLGGNIIITNGSNNNIQAAPVALIDKTKCEGVGWYWIDETQDVYIGSAKGNGFCMSRKIGHFSGGQGMGWNGWGATYGGWIFNLYSVTSGKVADSGLMSCHNTSNFGRNGQTRTLDEFGTWHNPGYTEGSYGCVPIGSSLGSFDTVDGKGDTIENRMKWLNTNGNDLTQMRSISWVGSKTPPAGESMPSLFVSDCLDGEKDLGTPFTYTHNNDSIETITYDMYHADDTGQAGCTTELSNTIYQNRQKYLVAWTQKSGSHIPSSFSHINNGSSGPCVGGNCYWLNSLQRGEYQAACEEGKILDRVNGSDYESVRFAAIGHVAGPNWGTSAQVSSLSGGCSSRTSKDSGIGTSARFIIRP